MALKKEKVVVGYKSVTDDLKSGHGSQQWIVGKWYKHDKPVELCKSGFHASRHPFDVLNYLQGNRFFLVEAKGKIIDDENNTKFVANEMRLVAEVVDLKRLSVEFAVWNAKRCLENFEKAYPKDDRVRLAIVAAENWLNAKTEEEKSAARSARSAAESAWSAAESAWSAAESAAWSAAESARSAARSAAWSAAESARSAWSAAWSAAESARSAAEPAQRKKFLELIKKYTNKERVVR